MVDTKKPNGGGDLLVMAMRRVHREAVEQAQRADSVDDQQPPATGPRRKSGKAIR